MKIIEVEWLDACLEDANVELGVAEVVVPILRRNVGYLVKSDADKVVVAFGELDNLFKHLQAVQGTFAIPRGCIIKITELA